MLRFLVRQLKDAPVLVLGTYRHLEVQRSPALSQLIGSLMREGAHVPLFGMSLEDAAHMIEERAGNDKPQAGIGHLPGHRRQSVIY